ncbi:hypothetical protein M3Y97_00800500 [Aphelenchoides bicaudatus]|nr:hypothetical protein M3Y97_00800500 [Aphelenchoides bicaudatus]
MTARGNSIEKIFEKYKIKAELIEHFGITDGPSCLNSLYYLHACGYVSTGNLRYIVKDAIKFYAVGKEILGKHIQFYISKSSSNLKSAFILFPVFVQRCPDSITTKEDLLNAVNWINVGIESSDNILTVVHRACNAVLERAISLNLTKFIVSECFLRDYRIQKQWTISLRGVGLKARKRILGKIRELNSAGGGKYKELNDDQLLEYLLGNNTASNDKDFDEEGSNFSDSDFGESDTEIESSSAQEVDELSASISAQLNLSNDVSVLTMADVIGQLSLLQQQQTNNELKISRMPRNLIRRFYKSVKALIKEQCQYEDVEHFKRLLCILMATHSKKLISYCEVHLKSYAKRLQSDSFDEANEFFWLHFCKDPTIFRPFAVATTVSVLITHTNMSITDVVTKICKLSKEHDSKFMQNTLDIVLHGALERNYGFDVNLYAVYNLLMQSEKYNWYKSWRALFDGLFRDVPTPVPLAYFKYKDVDLLDNALAQLVFILSNKLSVLELIERLQFSLHIFERIYWMGPLDFDLDSWTQSKAADIVSFLEAVDRCCPAYLFKKQIRSICLRFKNAAQNRCY